jgi:glycine dehydrogenase
MASTLADALNKLGVYQTNTAFFDTIVKTDAKKIRTIAEKNEINFFYIDDETISISLNETTLLTDIDQVIAVFAEAVGKEAFAVHEYTAETNYPTHLSRTTDFLLHDVFNNHHSETSLMRYIKIRT